jgi:hypothetical protein
MAMFTRLLERFGYVRRDKFIEFYYFCVFCNGSLRVYVESPQQLTEWHEHIASYHAECKPIGMCDRHELEHALQWRYPANQNV